MVKELVMDNLYNTNMLPSKINGVDKFTYDTKNNFQNIFSNKNNMDYADIFKQKDFYSADNRMDKMVSNNLAPSISQKDTPNISTDDRVSKDGYSFSIKDTLQETDSSEGNNFTVEKDKEIAKAPIDNEQESVTISEDISQNDLIDSDELKNEQDEEDSSLDSEIIDSENISNEDEPSKINQVNINSESINLSNSANMISMQTADSLEENDLINNENIVNQSESIDVQISTDEEFLNDNYILESDVVTETAVTEEVSNNGIELDSADWAILDEQEQYEVNLDLIENSEAELNINNTDLSSEVEDEVTVKDVNSKTEEVISEVSDNILDSNELTGEEIGLNQNNINSTEEIKTNNKENNSQSTVKSNAVEIADKVSQSMDEIENENQLDGDSEKIAESKVNEQVESSEVVEIVEDEITDADIEIKADDNVSDVIAAVDEESETDIEIDGDDQSANSDSKNENTQDKENQEKYKSTDKIEPDVDINLDERRKLAYVDMTKNQDTDADVIGALESKISMYGEKEEAAATEETIQNITDILDNSDIDVETVSEKTIKPTTMDELVDEEMLDELNITLKNSTSGVKEGYTSTSTTAEQLIRYAIEGENNFDTRLSATLRPTVQTQGEVSNSSSKEILAQITEKLTSFNFKTGSKLTIQLSPESMGTVEIKLTHTTEGIKAEMSAASDDARDMLNKNLDDLRDTLQKYGVRLDKVGTTNIATQQSTAHQDYTEQGNSQRQQQGQRQQNEKSTKEMERFEDMVSSLTEEDKE